MAHALTSHADYIAAHGALKWILRECVRANPFYVISAMVLMYGLVQLNVALNAPPGDAVLALLIFGLIHLYEVAVLAAAIVVLMHRKLKGGRDLHGLTMVAAIFLGGSFLGLDQLITIWPSAATLLVMAVLIWTAVKLKIYSTLPGIVLPPAYRWTMLILLAGHSVSSLLGDDATVKALGSTEVARNLGWFCGWLSTFAAVWLVSSEREAATAHAARGCPFDFEQTDILQTRWCGGWGVLLAWALGVLHLLASDWVFDRGRNPMLFAPEATGVLCALSLRWWFFRKRVTVSRALMLAAPSLCAVWLWWKVTQGVPALQQELFWSVHPAGQMLVCAVLFYIALVLGTRRLEFSVGILPPMLSPVLPFVWGRTWWRAVLAVCGGFGLLGLGVLMSLYRDKLLAKLDPPKRDEPEAQNPEPPEPSGPPPMPANDPEPQTV